MRPMKFTRERLRKARSRSISPTYELSREQHYQIHAERQHITFACSSDTPLVLLSLSIPSIVFFSTCRLNLIRLY